MTLSLKKKIPMVEILTLSWSLKKNPCDGNCDFEFETKIPVVGILSLNLKERNPCGGDFDFEFEGKKSLWWEC